MSLRVVRPGLITTVQDLGRAGWQRYGVAVGGAMDALALRVANLLAGPTLEFERDHLIAICGADLSATIEGEPVPLQRPVFVPAGSTLAFGAPRSGCRAYLAVSGGIDVPEVMGSRSTDLRAGIGGLAGRALQAGDEVRIGESAAVVPADRTPLRWFAGVIPHSAAYPTLRIVPGAEFDHLDEPSRKRLLEDPFRVSHQADRMGYRLEGPELRLADCAELISTAVCPGTLQLPPDGRPILLMVDCATTGGYAKIAHVVSADLSRAAQLKPGDSFRLRAISLSEAHNLYRQQEADLRRLAVSLRLKTGR
jgi:antagonist of KipI